MADKHYLNAVGWRGIRQRKTNIGKAVQTASALLRGAGKPVHVLDIASGHGRYVLDALSADALPDSVRLRDYSLLNVEAGRCLIAERGLQNIVSFDQLDAFDRTLTSHKDGSPNWMMRRRSQREMDQLVEAAGFEKIRQWIDGNGIFTVSLAVKK